MKISHISQLAFDMWLDHQVPGNTTRPIGVMLLGPPGIGKTSVGVQLVDRMTAHRQASDPRQPKGLLEVKDLTSSTAEDLGGMPKIVGNERDMTLQTVYAAQSYAKRLSAPDAYGVLILDDLPAAPGSVQNAARQIVLDRRMHETELNREVMLFVTGNRRQDKANATTLPSHFRNSVMHLELVPDFAEWHEYYTTKVYNADPVIPAFLMVKAAAFSTLPDKADENGVFATPRTWTMLGARSGVARKGGFLLEMASGLVGTGFARELVAFERLRSDMNPEEFLANPAKVVPDPTAFGKQMDQFIALLTAMTELSAHKIKLARERLRPKGETPTVEVRLYTTTFLRALGHLCENRADMTATAVTVFTLHGGSVADIHDAMQANRMMADPKLRKMFNTIITAITSSSSKASK